MSKEQILFDLLMSLLDNEELRRFLQVGPQGPQISRSLPSDPVSPDSLTWEAVRAAQSFGVIDNEFFDRLVRARPRRQDRINVVRGELLGDSAVDVIVPDGFVDLPSGAGRLRWITAALGVAAVPLVLTIVLQWTLPDSPPSTVDGETVAPRSEGQDENAPRAVVPSPASAPALRPPPGVPPHCQRFIGRDCHDGTLNDRGIQDCEQCQRQP